MTKEQEEAIKILSDEDCCWNYPELKLIEAHKTVLNLLQQLEREKQAHIRIEQTYKKEYLDAKAEIEKKDKIINLMLEHIDFDTLDFNCSSLCVHDNCQEECIKQYFESKVEAEVKENENREN